MSSRRTILQNTAALYALQASNYLFPLLVIPYLLRAIGVAEYGKIAFAGAVVSAFAIAVEFSFDYTATARIASHPDDVLATSQVYSIVMATKAALMLACCTAIVLVTFVVPTLRAIWPLIIAQLPLLLGEVLFPTWLFQGLQQLTYVTLFNVVSRIVSLALLLAIVRSPEDSVAAAGIQASHYVVAGAVAQVVVRGRLGIRFQNPTVEARALVRDSARVFAGNLGIHVYVRAPMVLVGFLASAPLVGAFAVAQKIAGLLAQLTVPITQSLYPHLCGIAERDPQALAPLRNRMLLALGLGMSLAVIVLNLCRHWVVILLSGDTNEAVMIMIILFSPVIVVTAVNKLLAQFVMALRRFDEMKRISLGAAALLLILIAPFTYWLDAYGTIIVTLLIEILMTFQCFKITRGPFPTLTGRTATELTSGRTS